MKRYDILVIGMGPAGMAVTAMGSAMGLSVLAIEKDKIGGECLNSGCIPSKALLKAAETLQGVKNLAAYGIHGDFLLKEADPMAVVREKTRGINDRKFQQAFQRATLVQGTAEFLDERTVRVNGEDHRAKKIFIATGTEPAIPPIPGLRDLPDLLTNMNLFEIEKMPRSLTIIGGGAVGSEMAQAFSRLGTKTALIHRDPHLIPSGDEEAGRVLEAVFAREGIEVRNGAEIGSVVREGEEVLLSSDKGSLRSERLLVAAGRKPVLEPLHLDRAGVAFTPRGITVDGHMRTSRSHIYAVGDCNGHSLLTHAAMHQGMLALMHSLSPLPLPLLRRERYPVPWTVFTQPEISQVGVTEQEARERGLRHGVVRKEFRTYGRTVADGHPEGFIKIITGRGGRILGATIVGSGSGELIHEWTMAMQYGKRMHHVMMMQHAFPTMSMINKMITEDWMMGKMESPLVRKLIRMMR